MTELAQAIVNGLQMGFLYALVAVGLTIIWGLMEMINFAHGEFLMLSMYCHTSFIRFYASIRSSRCRSMPRPSSRSA